MTTIDEKLQILRDVARDFMNRDGLRQQRVLDLIEELDEQIAREIDEASPTPAVQAEAVRELVYPAEFTDELQWILGLICFQCIQYAQTLRKAGHDIPAKAEAEQAATIDWMLRHYLRDPENWRKTAVEEMRAMAAPASSAGDQEASNG